MYRLLILLFLSFLFGAVSAQIPSGYYDSANNLLGDNLKSALHDIIKNHKEYPYTSSNIDTWDILKETDRDTANSANVILFYSGWSVDAAQEYNDANGWSREHVWAKSHGDFGTDLGAGTDLHHLRPADISVNSARGNKDFDNGGDLYVDGDGTTTCRSDGDSWEPRDDVKGDVARMLFYMAVRYEGDDDEPDLELVDEINTFALNETGKGFHGKLSTLLEWHTIDPVDSFEINRNNVIYSFQGNRNPFIDHPEYVTRIWDGETSAGEYLLQGLKVYPNPVVDCLYIEHPVDEVVHGNIYSLTGTAVASFNGRRQIKVRTNDISAGCYILCVEFSKTVYRTKILIQE